MRGRPPAIPASTLRRALRALAAGGVLGLLTLLPACGEGGDLRGLEPGTKGVVRAVESGNVLVLDGGAVRLAEIEVPAALGTDVPAVAETAKAGLHRLAAGQTVRLAFGGLRQRDRFTLAHVFVLRKGKRAVWVQAEMVRAGLARVRSWPDNRARTAELLRMEAEARTARRGLWRDQRFRILDAEVIGSAGTTPPPPRLFVLVEGVVKAAEERKERLYLNFGDDWRTDFTASAASGALALWPRGGSDLLALQGQRIRVRGTVYWRNGPAIDLTHPEQIERVEENAS